MTSRASTLSSRPRRLPQVLLAAVMIGGTAVVAASDWTGTGAGTGLDTFASGPLYDAVVVCAGLACLLRALDTPGERAAWLCLGLAVLAWSGGEIYWTAAIEGNPDAAYPSAADVGYLLFYPLGAAGLLLLVRARSDQLDWRLWADGLIAGLGTVALGAAIVVEFVSDRTNGSALEEATTLAYPLGDILVLALVVGVVALTRWRPGGTWILLLAGLATMAFADIAYTLETNGAGILSGAWVEPFYLLAATFIGAASWQSGATTIQARARFDGWRELAVPGFVALVLIGLFALQYLSSANAFTTVMWAATMIAVLARLAITVAENKRLLEAVRTDPLTGLGNQGGMQVDLADRCRRAERSPVTLVMLDLNGFKRYNDTFGHPAGDKVLTELGARLGAATAGRGAAYRIGGDEFAVLFEGELEHGEAARPAAEALSKSGTGYELSAAWGAVSIPAEAATPDEAMHLADARMYAQKESRRPAQSPQLELEEDELDLDGEPSGDLGRAGGGEAVEERP